MFLPISLIAALVARYSIEWLLEPALPEHARSLVYYLAFGALTSVIFLASFEIAAIDSYVQSRRGRPPGLGLRLFHFFIPILPALFYLPMLVMHRWDAFVRFKIAPPGIALDELLLLAPFFWFELLAVLGNLRLSYGDRSPWESARTTWLFAPLLILLLAWQDVWTVHPMTRAAIYEFAPSLFLCMLLGAVVVTVLFPMWFVWLFPSRQLVPDELRVVLQDMAKRAGVALRGIHSLATGGRSLNAGVIGPVSWTRQVFFTDLMLAWFQPKQIQAVFAHELAHVKRRHLFRQLLFFLVLPWLLAEGLSPFLGISAPDATLWLFGGMLIFLLPAIKFLNHCFEHEADLFGARLLGGVEDMVSALREVEVRLAGRHDRSSLRHPSTRQRVDFLLRAIEAPASLDDWFARMRRVQAILFIGLGLGIGLFATKLVQDSRTSYPAFLLSSGYPTLARNRFLELPEPASAKPKDEWRRELDQAARGVLLVHGEREGPGLVELLRNRALRRAVRSLRRGHSSVAGERLSEYTEAHAWLGLVRRWGGIDEVVDAIYLYLDSYLDSDEEGQSRARKLLRGLEVPREMKKVVAVLLA